MTIAKKTSVNKDLEEDKKTKKVVNKTKIAPKKVKTSASNDEVKKSGKTAVVKKTVIAKKVVDTTTSKASKQKETTPKKTKPTTVKKAAAKVIKKETPKNEKIVPKKVHVQHHKEQVEEQPKINQQEQVKEVKRVEHVQQQPVKQNVQEQVIEKKEELPVQLKVEQKNESKNEVLQQALPIININELITVKDLAEKMKMKVGDILRKLMSMGSLATINQRLDIDIAMLLANEFGFEAKLVSLYAEEHIEEENQIDDIKNLLPRSPIVTIMGHVDHGKTSLLDALRHSNVIAGEAGGITQHIGAYRVKTSTGEITFLDTPGHEAFTAMRSRGADVTDIVILVVSATDGVMPQTIEAINHAKAANVPIIVAVNKIDLPTADPEKIRQEISNYGLLPEEWGGDTIMVDISAKQKINIDSLLELVQLKAEMMELKANPNKKAEGVVVEAKLDPKKGTIATILVQSGTLKVGDHLVVGTTYGKVRAMIDEYGKRFDKAIPSMPVEVLGINEPPQAGDKFIVLEHEYQAREIANARKEKVKVDSLRPRKHLSLLDVNAGKVKDLRIILKTDVQGSLGALCDALERMSNSEINLKIIHKGAGSITESDVVLAAASDALIVGFNIRPDASVEKLAETEGVSINVYRIIYELIADIKAAMEGLLDPDTKERIIGKAIVKQVFKLSSAGTVSGCTITEGKAQRGVKIRLLRDNVIVFEGNTAAIKRFKEDVKEVEKGYECGISIEKFTDIKISDIIEFFTIDKTARKLIEE
ncbi:MAG: translation initiation factor IF-2 [Endomicrobiia bacterium]|nr:translation initiation factor IF-2 [Endomicrobiaceae bacterium]MDD3052900.1 translation initiation factor IF-2 [Endomicrobiaceae bacterium]MDD3922122.1 translation initiation factor IF-2 [Endomicrobiaceae bacterium]MDD5101527.1 translation initiation factor IF-2 [Endomicrobiaceae bacterium]